MNIMQYSSVGHRSRTSEHTTSCDSQRDVSARLAIPCAPVPLENASQKGELVSFTPAPHPTNRATTYAPSRQALHKGEVVLIEERGGVAVVSEHLRSSFEIF